MIKMKRLASNWFLLVLVYYCCVGPDRVIVDALYKCETLDYNVCSASYPNCTPLILKSCCPGGVGLCVDIETYITYTTNEKSATPVACAIDPQTEITYELNTEFPNYVGYDVFPIPNATCESIGCEAKGLACKLIGRTDCDSKSPCCPPQPVCVEDDSITKHLELNGEKFCSLPCPEGHICRYIAETQTCLPLSCKYLNCSQGTECQELVGVGVVSCFKTIDFLDDPALTCETKVCPDTFECQKGVFSNADCVPVNIDLLGTQFNCSLCPVDWRCDTFGWGGLCIEWHPFSNGGGIECDGDACLFQQFCNTTTNRCEFTSCELNNPCPANMECIQYLPTHPRVCATLNVVPYSSIPETLIPFSERFNR
ncbi:hypothetical protein CYY_000749 [Polysphondylium violaceum]|uniref:DSCP-N domain-containing protein n=1 Tax=Polysphondylium violaceum TaxID=133409 RepID=A0A8J4Q4A9_9MYCE|nr:hypothetical protein CYY_000749 [Polysphondylium violaceum]